MATESHSRRKAEPAHAREPANTPPSPQVPHTDLGTDVRETIKHMQTELPHMAEAIKGKANVVGEQVKEQAQFAVRSVREEIAFIRKKFMGSRIRDHAVQLGAALLVASAMHMLFSFLAPHIPVSTRMFMMYLEHWQPGAFLVGLTVLSRAVDHMPFNQQYAWSIAAMCWTTAVLGWAHFPFTGVVEKAAISLPLNARNFVWLSALPPAVNWTVKKIRQF